MIDGLSIVPDFVTPADESFYLTELGRLPGPRGGRRVKRWGCTVYPDHRAEPEDVPPPWLRELGARLPMHAPDEFTLNDWPPGAALAHHVDFGGPVICVVSLLGDGVLQFKAHGRPHVTVICPRRGLCVMAGVARTVYQHAVMPSADARISLVFRTIR